MPRPSVSKARCEGAALSAEMGKKINLIIGRETQYTYTADDYVGMMYTNNSITAGNVNYDGIVLAVEKGVEYSVSPYTTARFVTSYPEISGGVGSNADFPYTPAQDGYLLVTVKKSEAPFVLTKGLSGLMHKVAANEDAIEELASVDAALGDDIKDLEDITSYIVNESVSVNSGRVSRSLSVGHGGKDAVLTMAVTSGTDSGTYTIYGANDDGTIKTSVVLAENVSLGNSCTFTVPSNEKVYLFTADNSLSSARTYSVKLAQKDGLFNKVNDLTDNFGYLVNQTVKVESNAQRTHRFTNVKAGDKIVVRVSRVSGTSPDYVLSWIKSGGDVEVYTGAIGYISDVLEVPQDALGIKIFMSPAASGNVNLIEVWDATKGNYIASKLNENINGLEYINNRQIYSVELNVSTNNSAIFPISQALARKLNMAGKFYILVDGTAKLASTQAYIRFTYTDNSYDDITAFMMGQNNQCNLITFEGNEYKTLKQIAIPANSIAEAGTLKITILTIEPSVVYQKYPLYGKNWMCFGDSITEFKNNYFADNRRYSDHLAILTQANVFNAGIGGTRLSPRDDLSLTPSGNQQALAAFDIYNMVKAWATNDYQYQDAALNSGLLTSAQQDVCSTKLGVLKNNLIDDFDIVTIFGGTNDYTGGSTIGDNILTNLNERTICGAINDMIKLLLQAKSNLRIYFFTPIIRMFDNTVSLATSSDVYVHSDAPDNKLLPEVCDIIEQAVKKNHIPVDNWYWSLGWNVYNFSEYFGRDYTHPYNGFRWLAEKMSEFVLIN